MNVVEPILPLDEIQGIATPGFFKPQQHLVGVALSKDANAPAKFKALLKSLSDEISTGRQTLEDRRLFRADKERALAGKPLLGVGLTARGLLQLTPGASSIPSQAFQQGLAARSAFLGDPSSTKDEGHPDNWVVGSGEHELDALFIVAGNTPQSVQNRTGDLVNQLKAADLQILYQEKGGVRPDLPGREHFGFDDGISQPGIRGRASEGSDDFITPRLIDPSQWPEQALYGRPGQDLIWPGVLVLGQPATSPDPLIPGIVTPAVPDWTRNGSFLVFRRLRQDVGLFWRTLKKEAEHLAKQPGFENMSDEKLASRIIGRWPSGSPVNRTPEIDNSNLGNDDNANNHFRFDSDTEPLPLTDGATDSFPQAKADPVGITCPWAAHIRKVNTRDSASDTGGRESTYARRLLRVGVPFGEPLKNRYAETKDDPEKGNRGLLFLSIQASIEDQFEFLVARWMGDPSRPKMPGGHDLLVGQNDAPGEKRVRKCVMFGSGLQSTTVATSAQWIIPTGGGYFFVPSISALRDVIAA
jgi:Dyp-type peroxidase family